MTNEEKIQFIDDSLNKIVKKYEGWDIVRAIKAAHDKYSQQVKSDPELEQMYKDLLKKRDGNKTTEYQRKIWKHDADHGKT